MALEFDCSMNGHIRQMLRVYGLRTSLFRLKVINALLQATREERVIGVQDVHAFIEASTTELSIISVREVLKRLAEVGVIECRLDKSYCFTSEAWLLLKPHLG